MTACRPKLKRAGWRNTYPIAQAITSYQEESVFLCMLRPTLSIRSWRNFLRANTSPSCDRTHNPDRCFLSYPILVFFSACIVHFPLAVLWLVPESKQL